MEGEAEAVFPWKKQPKDCRVVKGGQGKSDWVF